MNFRKKRVFKTSLVFLVVLCILAVQVSTNAEEISLQSSGITTADTSKSFSKEYQISLNTNKYSLVMQDSNWWGERNVTVSFRKTFGPSSVSVYIIDNSGNNLGYKTVLPGYSVLYTLPQDGGKFSLYAKANGSNGFVTLTVDLTW